MTWTHRTHCVTSRTRAIPAGNLRAVRSYRVAIARQSLRRQNERSSRLRALGGSDRTPAAPDGWASVSDCLRALAGEEVAQVRVAYCNGRAVAPEPEFDHRCFRLQLVTEQSTKSATAAASSMLLRKAPFGEYRFSTRPLVSITALGALALPGANDTSHSIAGCPSPCARLRIATKLTGAAATSNRSRAAWTSFATALQSTSAVANNAAAVVAPMSGLGGVDGLRRV